MPLAINPATGFANLLLLNGSHARETRMQREQTKLTEHLYYQKNKYKEEKNYIQFQSNDLPDILQNHYQISYNKNRNIEDSAYVLQAIRETRQHKKSSLEENAYITQTIREITRHRENSLEEIIRRSPLTLPDPALNNMELYSSLLHRHARQRTSRDRAHVAQGIRGHPDSALAAALAKFDTAVTIPSFGTEFLATYMKQDTHLDAEELRRYGLVLDAQNNGHFGGRFGEKYFDTPFNFCLTYDGRLVASVGFRPGQQALHIEQIQGIAGNAAVLRPVKWERALVAYTVLWAQQHRIPTVTIVSVDNNMWTRLHGHLTREQGKMLYDVTAKRSGFTKGPDGNYIRALDVENPALTQAA